MKSQSSLKKPFLIAEIGINHNGSLKIAKKMIKNKYLKFINFSIITLSYI